MLFELGLATALQAAPVGLPVPPARSSEPYSVIVGAGQLFVLAERAQSRGDVATAASAYRALAEDPNRDVRAEALFRHARMIAQRGDYQGAALLLRRLLDQLPGATAVRLELAGLLDGMGDREAALRELRAAQAAGLPADVATIVGRYSDALLAGRPNGASVEIAIAPDSNINRATRLDTLGTVIGAFEIGRDSQARSGVGLSLKGQAFRRFAIGGDTSVLVRIGTFADLYRKPEFNDLAVDVAAGPELHFGRSRINLDAGISSRWFGQEPFVRSARIAAFWSRPVGRRSRLRLGGSAALVDNRRTDLQDGKSFSGQATVEHALSPVIRVAVKLAGDRMAAKDPGYSSTAWRGGLLGSRDFGRVTLSGGLEIGRLIADQRMLLFTEKRADRFFQVSTGAAFRQLSFGGFVPSVRLSFERNQSTIEFYHYKRRRTEFALVRAF